MRATRKTTKRETKHKANSTAVGIKRRSRPAIDDSAESAVEDGFNESTAEPPGIRPASSKPRPKPGEKVDWKTPVLLWDPRKKSS
jgi:hypothetical protein